MNILVSSGTSDAINTNQRLRQRIAHGFNELGHLSIDTPIEELPQLLELKSFSFLLITGSIADSSVDLAEVVSLAQSKNIAVAFWLHDDPYEFDMHWRLESLGCTVFSNEPNCIPYYPKSCRAKSLALAASPLDDYPLPICIDPQPKFDLSFCGVAFPQRIAILRQLADAGFSISCWGDGWPDDLACAVNCRLGPVGLRELYSQSCFVLNLGREVQIANQNKQIASSTPGPRTFEAGLMGSIQLYLGQSPKIINYYTPSDGVIPVRRVDEICLLIKQAREHPEWRQTLSQAAISRTRRDHLYRHRCHDLLADLMKDGVLVS